MNKREHRKTASARQIQRERFGIDFDPPPPFVLEKPRDHLPAILKKAGLESRAWEHELAREWDWVVGSQLAEHTRPGKYAFGRLTIYVDSSPWLSAMEREFKNMLLEKLRDAFGKEKIKTISFSLDPD